MNKNNVMEKGDLIKIRVISNYWLFIIIIKGGRIGGKNV
jgi:hypothetical protein